MDWTIGWTTVNKPLSLVPLCFFCGVIFIIMITININITITIVNIIITSIFIIIIIIRDVGRLLK